MMLELEPALQRDPGQPADPEPVHIVTGRLVSLRFLLAALRRSRRVWLALALVGLIAGAGYHLAVPLKYSATATLYLVHPAGSSTTAELQNDLAMLSTAAVGHRAITLLGKDGKGLTPTSLLGKAPGTPQGGNVIILSISGPTARSAVQRVNAVASAFLTFRAQLYEAQNRALAAADEKQAQTLQGDISQLSAQIAGLGTQPPAGQLTDLQAQRTSDTTQLTGLQQSIQQANIDTLSVVSGSRVITPGTASPLSRVKKIGLDGLAGLVIGLGLGLIIVTVVAVLSDKVHRREDVAMLLDAPVGVSVGRVSRRSGSLRSLRSKGIRRTPELDILSHHLGEQVKTRGRRAAELLVAIDDVDVPATALAATAAALGASGRRVVLVDDTRTRSLGKALGWRGPGVQRVQLGGGAPVTLLVPPRPWEIGETGGPGLEALDDGAAAGTLLVLASVDPAVGASHLRRWASEAIVTVTAGVATTHRITAITELLGAAHIAVSSAVLLNADPADETAGLPAPELATTRFELVTATGPTT